jgi:serine/threonine-protein kinase RsbW
MSDPLPNVRLQLLNTPQNVVLVREMLTGVAEATRIETGDLNDIRTAVTEACNNVVLHAYGGGRGPMEVEVGLAPGSIGVLVRDRGTGIADRTSGGHDFDLNAEQGLDGEERGSELPAAGIGLHVIETLAQEVAFGRPTRGTEVQMRFALPLETLEPGAATCLPASPEPSANHTTVKLSIAPLLLARTILPRLVISLAARAHFSTDRISDVQLLADALASHTVEALTDDRLDVEIGAGRRALDLHIAPLRDGSAQRLLEDSKLDGLGSVIEKLTNARSVTVSGSYETLTLGLLDSR